MIAQAPRECVSAAREARFDDARETLVKAMAHYAVDLCTPWHISRELTAEQHTAGEKTLSRLPLPTPITPVALAEPKSLYRSCVAAAQETHQLFVARLKSGEDLRGELGHQILAHAVGFGLSVAHYVWAYLDKSA